MECEDDYEVTVTEIYKRALEREKVWIAHSSINLTLAKDTPNNLLSTCSYRGMGWKTSGYFIVCPRCKAKGDDVKISGCCAGCRRNGDGYGSELCECTKCGYFDYQSYDEA